MSSPAPPHSPHEDTPSIMDERESKGFSLPRFGTEYHSAPDRGAPSYTIQPRRFGAVEVPMVVLNIERARGAFGRTPSFPDILEPNRNSLQLYLNPDSPYIPPVLSHNASTHNVLLKVTVPKRTGRKRRRGADGPFEDAGQAVEDNLPETTGNNRSYGRLDHPKTLRRRLQDNAGSYHVEAVGMIRHTHRYRGLADFSWEASHSDFTKRFSQDILTGDINKIKNFKFTPGLDRSTNADIIPPPTFTHMTLPFNYNYEQNPYVRAVRDEGGEERVMNITAAVMVGHFVKPTVENVPTAPRMPPDLTDPVMADLMQDLDVAFAERPIWTRRSLLNRLGKKIKTWNVLKKYISYTAYQFKGGPFKDAVIAYGVDPRKDPKYRIYQTMFFKLPFVHSGTDKKTWHAIRKGQQLVYVEDSSTSHIFDGQTFYSNGKLWQVCDITDPMLAQMFADAAVRPTCDITGSGWFHQGLWAKAKAVMKCKLLAIRFNRQLDAGAFEMIHATRDETPPPGSYISIKLPSLNLTEDELKIMRGSRYKNNTRVVRNKQNITVKNKAEKAITMPDEDDEDDDEDEGEDEEEDNDDEGMTADNNSVYASRSYRNMSAQVHYGPGSGGQAMDIDTDVDMHQSSAYHSPQSYPYPYPPTNYAADHSRMGNRSDMQNEDDLYDTNDEEEYNDEDDDEDDEQDDDVGEGGSVDGERENARSNYKDFAMQIDPRLFHPRSPDTAD
ncbi:tau 95 subunit of transcription factor TFIIIC [Ceratocystis pirilliformis]|uniref:Tau 95 subunit of transcription factor TFIIIC n=1 Tax=Ceratocystis pirilliformis TaxID=259994 RepID=A0ABR3YE16_9PEZI